MDLVSCSEIEKVYEDYCTHHNLEIPDSNGQIYINLHKLSDIQINQCYLLEQKTNFNTRKIKALITAPYKSFDESYIYYLDCKSKLSDVRSINYTELNQSILEYKKTKLIETRNHDIDKYNNSGVDIRVEKVLGSNASAKLLLKKFFKETKNLTHSNPTFTEYSNIYLIKDKNDINVGFIDINKDPRNLGQYINIYAGMIDTCYINSDYRHKGILTTALNLIVQSNEVICLSSMPCSDFYWKNRTVPTYNGETLLYAKNIDLLIEKLNETCLKSIEKQRFFLTMSDCIDHPNVYGGNYYKKKP